MVAVWRWRFRCTTARFAGRGPAVMVVADSGGNPNGGEISSCIAVARLRTIQPEVDRLMTGESHAADEGRAASCNGRTVSERARYAEVIAHMFAQLQGWP